MADTPTPESTQQPQESSRDRLAGLLKQQFGNDFPDPEPLAPQPDSQAETAEPGEEVTEPPPETDALTEQEGQPEGDAPSETVAFEVDGKEYQVPKALEGHLLRQKDYTAKTMELAEDRKAVAAIRQFTEVAAHAATQLSDVVAAIKITEAQLSEFSPEKMRQMEITDPIDHLKAENYCRKLMDQRNNLIGQFNEADATMKKARQAEYAVELQRNEPIVRKAIPDWGPKKQQELVAAGQRLGYRPEELGIGPPGTIGITDARLIIGLNIINEYFKITAKRPATANAVQGAPPVNRPTQRSTTGAEIERKKAEARLAKTGDQDDLYAALKARRR